MRTLTRFGFITAAAAAVLAAAPAQSAIIDFETKPDGTSSTDDFNIGTNTYNVGGFEVGFLFDTNGDGLRDEDAIIEQVGDNSTNGFLNDTLGQWDTEAPGEPRTLDNFFLRRNTAVVDSGRPVALVIDYVTGSTRALGGEIWDIDGNPSLGTEQWEVSVFDDTGTLLDSRVSPLGDDFDMDGEAWAWSFAGLSAPAKQVRIDFTGSKDSGIGLAFDNFSVDRAVVPAPATLLLLGTGLIALGAFGRRRG